MEEHVSSVEKFHGMLSAQTEWLLTAEKRLRALKKPSKIYDGIQSQLRGLKVLLNLDTVQSNFFNLLHVDASACCIICMVGVFLLTLLI
jgi:hypothetical protein